MKLRHIFAAGGAAAFTVGLMIGGAAMAAPGGGASSCAPGRSANPPPGKGGTPPGQTCNVNNPSPNKK